MIRAGVMGATGYTGLEVIRLLSRHPQVELAFATARSDAGKRLCDLYPVPLEMVLARAEEVVLSAVDVLFLCLPHGAAQEWARRGTQAGAVVIDLSADHRLADADNYRAWYGTEHLHPESLAGAVYGLTEWRREALREAGLIANPGCYPTSILLAVAPLLKAGLLRRATIIADSKSGTSGAGRQAKVEQLFAEVNENFRPYAVGKVHRHVAEIEQELSRLAGDGGAPAGIVFSPHLLPVSRGILSTIYVPWPEGVDVRAIYQEAYAGEPFVWLLPEGQTASLAHVVHTNRCALSLHPVPGPQSGSASEDRLGGACGAQQDGGRGHLILVSAIDNLVKGAAGQAVQNMNVRFALEETAGLS